LTLRLQRRCADPDRVDDAVHDTFVAVWRGVGRWDGPGEVAA
jgi:RNA polymerase sigma-70 factor (ECF subfamily)